MKAVVARRGSSLLSSSPPRQSIYAGRPASCSRTKMAWSHVLVLLIALGTGVQAQPQGSPYQRFLNVFDMFNMNFLGLFGDPDDNDATYTRDQVEPELRTAEIDGDLTGSLPLYTGAVVEGYGGDEDLFLEDVQNSAKLVVNAIIERNVNPQNYYGPPVFVAFDGGAVASAAEADTAKVSGGSVGESFDSFAQNSQEQDVAEGDFLQTDGELVFTGYQNRVVMWYARTGERIPDFVLPDVEEEVIEMKEPEPLEKPVLGEDEIDAGDFLPEEPDADILPPERRYIPKPYIRDLLLSGDRLLIIADGYGYRSQEVYGRSTVLYDTQKTRIFQVDVSALRSGASKTLTIMDYQDINGWYQSSRSIRSNAHIVTSTGIDRWTYLEQPLDRRQNFEGLEDDEYREAARQLAEDELLPTFAQYVLEEIRVQGVMPDVARLSVLQKHWNTTESPSLYRDGAMNTFFQVTSLDMSAGSVDSLEAFEIQLSASGNFIPFYGTTVYASTDYLVLATQGWDWDDETWESNTYTYLMVMELSGSSSSPRAIGSYEGFPLNSYSMDEANGVFRIGLTIQSNNWWGGPRPIPFAVDVEPEPIAVATVDNGGMRRLQALGSLIRTFLPFPSEPEPAEELPPVVVNEEPEPEPESRTENWILTLGLPGADSSTPGELEPLGQLKLGLPNEVFTGMRFYDDVLYAVTFERTDPLYVVDLTDPTNPTVTDEVKVDGFSSYLIPMNEEKTLLFTLGQDADPETGIPRGTALSVFDVSIPGEARLASRFVIRNSGSTSASTQANWDFLGIRPMFDRNRVVIPLRVHDWRNPSNRFIGFVSFVVTEEDIYEDCRINQRTTPAEEQNECYPCVWTPSRALVFGGDVTTVDERVVKSTDLDSCQTEWEFDVTFDDPYGNCCSY